MTTDVERLLDLLDQYHAAKALTHTCYEAENVAREQSAKASEAEEALRQEIRNLVFVEWGEVSA